MKNIVLIGMPTSGKTTIARRLAKQLNRNCYEMDLLLEEQFQTTIANIFHTKGEAYFREAETKLAKKLAQKENAVISCGGGIILNPENMEALKKNGIIFWIHRSLEKLYISLDRPLLVNQEALKRLYEERYHLYQSYSDYEIQNNGTIEEAIQEIINCLTE